MIINFLINLIFTLKIGKNVYICQLNSVVSKGDRGFLSLCFILKLIIMNKNINTCTNFVQKNKNQGMKRKLFSFVAALTIMLSATAYSQVGISIDQNNPSGCGQTGSFVISPTGLAPGDPYLYLLENRLLLIT